MVLSLLAGRRPDELGVSGARLRRCPSSPNCVCSDDSDAEHGIEAFALETPPDVAWKAAVEEVSSLARCEIVSQTADYLHAECRSALLGFVDDLELHLRADARSIAVRSASRLGRSDLGVNRRRVEALRSALAARGVVEGG